MDITLAELQGVPQGCSRKVPHEGCSNSSAMVITNDVEGYLVYCHKCGDTCFIPHKDSIQERAERKALQEATQKVLTSRDYSLPADFSNDIADAGLAWLGSGGWTQELILRYRVGWSSSLQRVILPLREGFVARAVLKGQNPKYIEKVPPNVVWKSEKESLIRDVSKVCFITEDILSAGRLGEYVQTYALCGTSVSTSTLSVFKNYDKIFMWLDPDRAGISGVRKAVPRLSLFSAVSVLKELREPKHVPNAVLQKIVQEAIQ